MGMLQRRTLDRVRMSESQTRRCGNATYGLVGPTPRKKWAAPSRPTATAPAKAPSLLWNCPRPHPPGKKNTQQHKEKHEKHRP